MTVLGKDALSETAMPELIVNLPVVRIPPLSLDLTVEALLQLLKGEGPTRNITVALPEIKLGSVRIPAESLRAGNADGLTLHENTSDGQPQLDGIRDLVREIVANLPAPQVTVSVPPAEPPVVNVSVPRPNLSVIRDANGRISGARQTDADDAADRTRQLADAFRGK